MVTEQDIKESYISSFSFTINDIKNPYSEENKEIYKQQIKKNLNDISYYLADTFYNKSFIYSIAEVYEMTSTVILHLDKLYNKDTDTELSEKQILIN